MNIVLYSNKIDEYLKHDDVIDYENEAITELADKLFKKTNNEFDFIKAAYEFVRDTISHSADINKDVITCTASEVLKAGHGICFEKSHLLTALLRCKSIPSGFCYQKIILDDETAPVLVYHGLNGVYIKDYKKWIRLDARGNKNGVNAQFSVETEQLAYPIRPKMGEEDNLMVYPAPDIKIMEKLRKIKTRTELWDNLPTELEYELQH
ncbi:MAG: transglutaminase-like domain-containing protein [Oscillospiraceae bacterium]|nr:transglutaminase-like domain-containing protein [Oscillospiraceae bacterium]